MILKEFYDQVHRLYVTYPSTTEVLTYQGDINAATPTQIGIEPLTKEPGTFNRHYHKRTLPKENREKFEYENKVVIY